MRKREQENDLGSGNKMKGVIRMKKALAFIMAAAMMISLAACSVSTKDSSSSSGSTDTSGTTASSSDDKIVRWGYDMADLGNLDVNLSTLNVRYEVSDLILDTLVKKDPKTMEIVPSLCESLPEISSDGLTYTFKLKKGVKFHDGTELTAKDVEFTFYRMFAPQYKGDNNWYADMIVGAQELMDGKADTLSGFKVVDDYNFTITLNYAFSAFKAVIAASAFGIVPKAACEAAGDRWGIDTIIGTGPFKVTEFVPNQKIVFTTNDDYFAGRPKIDGIEMDEMDDSTAQLEFEAGTIDVMDISNDLVDTYLNDPKYKDDVVHNDYMATCYLMLNLDKPPLDNVKVRQAIAKSIDVDQLLQTYFKGHVTRATTYLPAGMVGCDKSLSAYSYDPDGAKALLKEAGFPDGIEFTVTQSEDSSYLQIEQIMQEMMKASNIKMNIAKVDAATWMDYRKGGQLQAYCNTYTADYPDPDQFYYSIFMSSSAAYRSTGLRSTELDDQINSGRLITDQDEKQSHYAAMDKFIVVDNVDLVPLYYGSEYIMVSSRLTNIYRKNDDLIYFTDAEFK